MLRRGFRYRSCRHGLSVWGARDCHLWIPTVANSMRQQWSAHNAPLVFDPLRQALAFPEGDDDCVCSLVSGILLRNNPAAIPWFVIPVVVLAVDFQAFGIAVRHSPFQKDWILIPRGTNSDSATAVISISRIVGITAAIAHC